MNHSTYDYLDLHGCASYIAICYDNSRNDDSYCDHEYCHNIRSWLVCIKAKECEMPYKQNIWRTLYLANEGKNRIGERLNWRSTL